MDAIWVVGQNIGTDSLMVTFKNVKFPIVIIYQLNLNDGQMIVFLAITAMILFIALALFLVLPVVYYEHQSTA